MSPAAIFSGTFDPPTLGHLDIIEKGKRAFDQLIVCIGVNPNKGPLFSLEERIEMMKRIGNNVEIASFNGLIAEFAKEKKAGFLIRGVRSLSHFEYELQIAQANRCLRGIDTVFFSADPQYAHISSSLVRELIHFNEPLTGWIPKEIEGFIQELKRSKKRHPQF